MQVNEEDRLSGKPDSTPNYFGMLGFVLGVALVLIGYFGFQESEDEPEQISEDSMAEVVIDEVVLDRSPPVPEVAQHPLPAPVVKENVEPAPVKAEEPQKASAPVEDKAVLSVRVLPLPSPLPAIDSSDSPLTKLIGVLVEDVSAASLLIQKNIIRQFVVAVDNASKGDITQRIIPLKSPGADFIVEKSGNKYILNEKVFSRYDPYVDTIASLDVGELATVYTHFYPLMQAAYRDLGYPRKHFNDRFIEALDQMLATPEVMGDIELVKPGSLFKYKSKELENLPLAQKQLLRLGGKNAAKIKLTLCGLRAKLTTSQQPENCPN